MMVHQRNIEIEKGANERRIINKTSIISNKSDLRVKYSIFPRKLFIIESPSASYSHCRPHRLAGQKQQSFLKLQLPIGCEFHRGQCHQI